MAFVGLLLLAAVALGLRAGAAALRTPPVRASLRTVGWVLAAVAAWLAAGAAGAWSPLWPALLAAAALALVDRRGRSFALWAGADALLVTGLGALSVPALTPARVAAAALLMAVVGFGLDGVVGHLPARWHRVARWASAPAVLGVGAFLALAVAPAGAEPRPTALPKAVSLFSAVTPATVPGERRLTLGTGAVAWLDRPRADEDPRPGALFLHGNNADGAHQPTALAVRRALLEAGFVVLAVDHPGYGGSPHAAPEADDIAAWDPLPTDLAAYEALCAVPGVRGVTVVGHSMGNGDLLALLAAGVPLDAAVMMGAALPDPGADAGYWDRRFLTERRITAPMDAARVREIRGRYYDVERHAREVPESHPPVEFVTFGVEWPDIAATRDTLYGLLPGPKTAWRMTAATHYLSTKGWGGLAIGDTRATRTLAAKFRELAERGPAASPPPPPAITATADPGGG